MAPLCSFAGKMLIACVIGNVNSHEERTATAVMLSSERQANEYRGTRERRRLDGDDIMHVEADLAAQ